MPDGQSAPKAPLSSSLAQIFVISSIQLTLKRPAIYRISMQTLHVETTCTEAGVLILRDLPIQEGDCVDVVVIPRSSAASMRDGYPLRGEPVEYIRPFEPVAESEWEAAR